jgi:hypothetical protein
MRVSIRFRRRTRKASDMADGPAAPAEYKVKLGVDLAVYRCEVHAPAAQATLIDMTGVPVTYS